MEDKITINGIEYVRADKVAVMAEKNGKEYVIIRAREAGVFAGYWSRKEGSEVTLLDARRLWYWSGAASLSQLAVDGVSEPNECKFPCEVPMIHVLGVIEIIPATEKAQKSIAEVPVWSA